MKPIKTFIMGSSRFFGQYPDYIQKDIDELNIMDEFIVRGNVLNMKTKDKDVFFFRDMDKDGFIEDCLSCKVPMRVGKFLIPDFAEHLGMNVEDLKRLDEVFNKLDDAHKYEKIIYEAYLENGGFFLTDEQRDKAYKEYKRERPDLYKKNKSRRR